MPLIDPSSPFVPAAETAFFGIRPMPAPFASSEANHVSSRLRVGMRDHLRRWSPVAGKIRAHVIVAAG
ncbi:MULTISPECIES: hypothetical protein [Burkholderia]|uniref:hypothetical protein n=1 Tax=Burkholderia TaxID=32008 RepID=UPI00157A235A|nr:MULTISPECIES: hypothetical protein [Burkholderia]MCU9953024.1 hypothetical protein [Burkholderia sp. BKH01]NTY34904.1 hypothetical protein [Burkholderia diffusa]